MYHFLPASAKKAVPAACLSHGKYDSYMIVSSSYPAAKNSASTSLKHLTTRVNVEKIQNNSTIDVKYKLFPIKNSYNSIKYKMNS